MDRHRSPVILDIWYWIIPTIQYLIPILFLSLFYFYPLARILGISLARAGGGEQTPGGIAAPFVDALTSPATRGIIWFTIWQAVVSTILTLLIGLPGAYILARYDFQGKSIFRALTGIPFVMPTLVVAAGFNALLGPTGWVNVLLTDWFNLSAPPIQFIQTLGAILIAHVFYNTTIVLRLVGDFWTRLDPRLVSGARILGASRWEAFRRITLPLLLPAITAAALLVFIFDFSSFAVILLLGGPKFATLETEIYYQTTALFNLPLAAALSIIQLLCTLAMTVIYTRLSTRIARPLKQRSSLVTMKKIPPLLNIIARERSDRSNLPLSRGIASPSKAMADGYIGARNDSLQGFTIRLTLAAILLLTTAPLLALAARSFVNLAPERTRTGELERGLTLVFYRALAENPTQSIISAPPTTALTISLGYATATVILSLTLGLPTAWALVRNRASLINRFLDPILMLPLGTSAVTLGLGFIVALNRPPLDLRASPLLIPLAHTLVAFPFVVRSLTPALQSIQPRLRQAAAVLGAAPAQVIRFVDLPLVGRALLVAATFAFTISLGEFGATALIARPEYPTVPVTIYRLLGRPGALNYGQGLALSTILMLVTTGGMLAIERLRVGEGEAF
ncbi:MAG TPA: iron ABC transporter permease [Anaerolineales bacterium]|nr:iron ABC transporter permease [Anaerolineales bacterium]